MHFSTSSLVTLAIAVSSVGAQYAAVNPPASEVKDVDWSALPPVSNDVSTNAKRFAQGLPPINPVKRGPHRGGPHRDGSIRMCLNFFLAMLPLMNFTISLSSWRYTCSISSSRPDIALSPK
jgi:hypothetical protein